MISFRILTKESEREITEFLLCTVPGAKRDEVEDILLSFSGDFEVAVSAAYGCMLLRIFDGEYLFPYPVALTDTADARSASDAIRLYAIKEEIPLIFIDVPSEELSGLVSLFRHTSAESEDESDCTYTVSVLTELDLIDEPPSVSDGTVMLNALTVEDSSEYFRLSTDVQTNEYWGYDYSADAPDADEEYFINTADEEFARGSALSLGVRFGGQFVGEAVLYAFDMQGGAECAIRLLPEHRGKGIGTATLDLTIKIAEQIGLERLYATVDNANTASLALFSGRMQICDKKAEKTRFSYIL